MCCAHIYCSFLLESRRQIQTSSNFPKNSCGKVQLPPPSPTSYLLIVDAIAEFLDQNQVPDFGASPGHSGYLVCYQRVRNAIKYVKPRKYRRRPCCSGIKILFLRTEQRRL